MATFTENKRRLVVVELAEMVEHKRDVAASAALASSARRADPPTPDLLQRVATEDAAAVSALLARSPGLRRMLVAASRSDRQWGAAQMVAALRTPYIFGGRPGGAPNSRTAQLGAVDDRLRWLEQSVGPWANQHLIRARPR